MNYKNIGILGFGEAGQNIAEGLTLEKNLKVTAYDVAAEKYKNIAEELGVKLFTDKNSFIENKDIIFSLVPCSASILVIREFIPLIEKDTILIDLSAALPAYMEEGAELAEKKNKYFLDGAIMGSVTNFKHKVPIFLSGKYSKDLDEFFTSLKMNVDFIGSKQGQASASKLCRSIYTKGTEALLVELKKVTEHYGITDKVFESIDKTYYLKGFIKEAERLLKSNDKHIERKHAEVLNVKDMIEDTKLDAEVMSTAAAKVFARKMDK